MNIYHNFQKYPQTPGYSVSARYAIFSFTGRDYKIKPN